MLMLRQGLWISIGGIAAGLAPGAAVFARVMTTLVYGVTPMDPLTLGLVCVLLLSVTVAASCLPALRALRIDPVSALRFE
jgi:putative ABC transport system permease protein